MLTADELLLLKMFISYEKNFPWNSCIKGKNHADTQIIHTHTVFLFTMGKNTLSPSNIHSGKLLNDFLSVLAMCGDWLEVAGVSQESLGLKSLQGPQIYRKEGEWMVTCWCCTQYVGSPLRDWPSLFYISRFLFVPLLRTVFAPSLHCLIHTQPFDFRATQMITFCTLCLWFRSRGAEAKQLWRM